MLCQGFEPVEKHLLGGIPSLNQKEGQTCSVSYHHSPKHNLLVWGCLKEIKLSVSQSSLCIIVLSHST